MIVVRGPQITLILVKAYVNVSVLRGLQNVFVSVKSSRLTMVLVRDSDGV